MHIIFLNGNEFRGSWGEFTRALRHPWFIGLILAMVLIIILVRPYDHILPEGVILRTLIVSSAVAVFLTIAIFLISRRAKTEIAIHSLTMMLPAIFFTSVWGVWVSVLTGGTALGFVGWLQFLGFNFIFCMSGEIILSSFLLRRIAIETGLRTHPMIAVSPSFTKATTSPVAPLPGPKRLEVLGQTVVLADIWHLKAEEHYVLLGLRDGTSHLLRGRLVDAIAQVPSDAGLQVHRSHWVAAAAVAGLERRRDGWLLHLHNGKAVPVARNRQTTVRGWVEAAGQTA